ncbi:MAG: hypothetical protein ACI828_000470 [Flavobacteriales bacterium]|jgi:hypothetical protein
MRFKIILSFALMLLSVNTMLAGFPVTRAVAAVTNVETVSVDVEDESALTSPAAASQKSQGVALLLWLFLGGFAAHRWYLGSPVGWNILYIVTLGGLFVWAVIDLIDIITGDWPVDGGFKSEFW